jgi:hypothetical protein
MNDLIEFKILINNHEFVKAHKMLEPMWKEYKNINKDEANILKGFINATTAIALYQKGKIQQYKKVWETFLKYEPLIDTILSDNKKSYIDLKELLHQKQILIVKE